MRPCRRSRARGEASRPGKTLHQRNISDINFDTIEARPGCREGESPRIRKATPRRRLIGCTPRREGGVITAVDHVPGRRAAERRHLTVLFCDLVGSTAMSTRLDPEEFNEIIGAYRRCCVDVIGRARGFIAQYLGDGLLVYFGYPRASEDDAERAVSAGLALVEAVSKQRDDTGKPMQSRVGVASGLVLVGDLIAAGVAQGHGVVGETPNLAARLQVYAEPNTVIISEETRRLIGELFECRPLGDLSLKGFATSVQAWRVIGANPSISRLRALRTPSTPLADRVLETDLMVRRWQQAKAGDGCVLLISGEPGIGKSRVVQALLSGLAAEPHVRVR